MADENSEAGLKPTKLDSRHGIKTNIVVYLVNEGKIHWEKSLESSKEMN